MAWLWLVFDWCLAWISQSQNGMLYTSSSVSISVDYSVDFSVDIHIKQKLLLTSAGAIKCCLEFDLIMKSFERIHVMNKRPVPEKYLMYKHVLTLCKILYLKSHMLAKSIKCSFFQYRGTFQWIGKTYKPQPTWDLHEKT